MPEPAADLKEDLVLSPQPIRGASVGQVTEGAAEAPSGPVVLATNLDAPRLRAGLLPRDRLLERLVHSDARLTLVGAGAGWGKTTLLVQWASVDKRRFAWLSLERADNDPVRFWTCVVMALRVLYPDIGEAALALLRAPGVRIAETAVPTLLNELDAIPDERVLVLDDYHLIGSGEVHEQVGVFVERLPEGMRVAIASRVDPPLPLARLRVRGDLLEIRSDELRLDEAESASLLNGLLELGLTTDGLTRLVERTEGWPAGLYLAALSLEKQTDREAFVAAFAGDHRHVVDYLGAEVLAALSAHDRTFLLRSSVLARLSGPLCDAVTGLADSAAALERIERSNLFLIPLDERRRWYRYHHLFGELLLHELERTEPEIVPELHQRAAAWYRSEGAVGDAIHHATAAGEVALVADLIAEHWLAATNDGRVVTVAGWLDDLSAETVENDPRLCLARAGLALAVGRPEDVPIWLERIEREPRSDPLLGGTHAFASTPAIIRAGYCCWTGDVGCAETAARRVLELEPPSSPWYPYASSILGASRYWSGDSAAAIAAFEQALRLARPANATVTIGSLGNLARMRAERGELGHSDALLADAAEIASAVPGHDELWMMKYLHFARAALLERRGALSEADAALRRGLELARRGRDRPEIAYGLLALARVRRRLHRHAQARALVEEARAIGASCRGAARLAEMLDAAERGRTRAATGQARAPLSERELAVLRLLATRLTLKEIGDELFVSENTVKTHARNIYRKLSIPSRADAIAAGRELGLL
jgi:LuxR family transcriptional regulator, maltose regulon positive regulatory protein